MDLAEKVGFSLANTHAVHVIHGDLTTSNMMLRRDSGALVLIDFGLSYIQDMVEDKAVDLYVLERACSSTHPQSSALVRSRSALYLAFVRLLSHRDFRRLTSWSLSFGGSVRLRGRKRTMVGLGRGFGCICEGSVLCGGFPENLEEDLDDICC
ncbi:MAG: hypothetical protein BJ554DRAFT_7360 [Olpidium bornovanus]|uniref:non-specific serine/threonine protein kinase n=1 Tax=Olpidium bornovanus TaxID=278681 RepID=A0A8H8A1L5_9FUNG|nr:MAG: hypothetical protein BJ554DRAFT_7360 [Olpidium bornovanus]